MPSPIVAFMHCAQCQKIKPSSVSPAEFARLEIGLDKGGTVIVWCVRHDMLVAMIKPERPLPRNPQSVSGGLRGHSGDG
jgi:hypothetical protein